MGWVASRVTVFLSEWCVLLAEEPRKRRGMRGDGRMFILLARPSTVVLQGTGSWRVTCRSGEW